MVLDPPSRIPQARMMSDAPGGAETVPVVAGRVAVSATVTMVYRLEEPLGNASD